jgi:hypothetical protein
MNDRIERAAIALAHNNWEVCMRHARATGQNWTISFDNFWKKNAAVAREQARIAIEAADKESS